MLKYIYIYIYNKFVKVSDKKIYEIVLKNVKVTAKISLVDSFEVNRFHCKTLCSFEFDESRWKPGEYHIVLTLYVEGIYKTASGEIHGSPHDVLYLIFKKKKIFSLEDVKNMNVKDLLTVRFELDTLSYGY